MTDTLSTIVAPEGSLEVLSQHEVERLRDTLAAKAEACVTVSQT